LLEFNFSFDSQNLIKIGAGSSDRSRAQISESRFLLHS